MVSSRLERHDWSSSSRRIDKVQRSTEEARQSIRQCQPSSVSPADVSPVPIYRFSQSHSSSVSASTHAHSSTPVPPSLAPPQGLAPQLSASHLPKLNLKWSSRVFACCNICPRLLGKYLKFCCSKEAKLVLLWKLNEASSKEGCKGRRSSCSW